VSTDLIPYTTQWTRWSRCTNCTALWQQLRNSNIHCSSKTRQVYMHWN